MVSKKFCSILLCRSLQLTEVIEDEEGTHSGW